MEADTASTYVIEIIMSKLMIGLMGEGDSEHPLVSPVSSHTTRAINDFTMAPPVGVNSQINKPQFSKTVTQKTVRKDCFLDLWRNFCWATTAPGQPPASDSKCRVLSGVRHAPSLAADLSTAYIMKVSKLSIKYTARISGGILDVTTVTATMTRNKMATLTDSEPFICFVFCGSRSPANVAFTAQGRPCLSVDKA